MRSAYGMCVCVRVPLSSHVLNGALLARSVARVNADMCPQDQVAYRAYALISFERKEKLPDLIF